jgi:hypothetical protein
VSNESDNAWRERRFNVTTAVGVVAAGVDVGAVRQEAEGIVQMGAGVGVFAVVGVESTVHQVELARNAARPRGSEVSQ